jgi:hypothetical protein
VLGGGGGAGGWGISDGCYNAFQKNLVVNWERGFATSFQKDIVVDFVTEQERTLNRQCSSKGKTWMRRS